MVTVSHMQDMVQIRDQKVFSWFLFTFRALGVESSRGRSHESDRRSAIFHAWAPTFHKSLRSTNLMQNRLLRSYLPNIRCQTLDLPPAQQSAAFSTTLRTQTLALTGCHIAHGFVQGALFGCFFIKFHAGYALAFKHCV